MDIEEMSITSEFIQNIKVRLWETITEDFRDRVPETEVSESEHTYSEHQCECKRVL